METGLNDGNLTQSLVNELIRDVCTCILTYTRYPSAEHRRIIAKMLVKKYPCLADKKITDNTMEWVRTSCISSNHK